LNEIERVRLELTITNVTKFTISRFYQIHQSFAIIFI
jgi:hypothetical protein